MKILPGYKKYPIEDTPDGPAIKTEYGLILLHKWETDPNDDYYFRVEVWKNPFGPGTHYLDGDKGGKGTRGGFGRPAEIYHRVRFPTLEEFA